MTETNVFRNAYQTDVGEVAKGNPELMRKAQKLVVLNATDDTDRDTLLAMLGLGAS